MGRGTSSRTLLKLQPLAADNTPAKNAICLVFSNGCAVRLRPLAPLATLLEVVVADEHTSILYPPLPLHKLLRNLVDALRSTSTGSTRIQIQGNYRLVVDLAHTSLQRRGASGAYETLDTVHFIEVLLFLSRAKAQGLYR